MKLISVFSIVSFKVFLVNLFKVPDIVRAFWVDAFVDDKVLAVLFRDKEMHAMRTFKLDIFGETVFVRRKYSAADFTFQLTEFTVVAV